MRKHFATNFAASIIVLVWTYQVSAAEDRTEGHATDLRETLKAKALYLSKMFGSEDVTADYCNTLLSDMKIDASRLTALKPIASKETFDPHFGKDKGQCPALQINRHAQLLQNVRYDWWLTLPEDQKAFYATYWYGTKNLRLYELPGFGGMFIFYAEAYFSEEVVSRLSGQGNVRFGYANSPGNSARFDIYDFRACKWLGGNYVHEAKYHLTGESLPNKSALFKHGKEFICKRPVCTV